jgi:hypothetical protein
MQPATTDSPAHVETRKPIFWIFIIALIGVALFLGINAYFLSSETASIEPEEALRSDERVKNLADIQAEETQKLTTFGWVNQPKGEVRIPVDRAMKQVLLELNAKEPMAAYPILDATGQPIPTEQDPAELPQDPASSEQEISTKLIPPVKSKSGTAPAKKTTP